MFIIYIIYRDTTTLNGNMKKYVSRNDGANIILQVYMDFRVATGWSKVHQVSIICGEKLLEYQNILLYKIGSKLRGTLPTTKVSHTISIELYK